MSMSGCVKIAEAIFTYSFSQYFLNTYDIIGRNFHDIFCRSVSLVSAAAHPNILCPRQTQVLHSLLTRLRTLSAAFTAPPAAAPAAVACF
jgi:hypothetical protein